MQGPGQQGSAAAALGGPHFTIREREIGLRMDVDRLEVGFGERQ